MYQAILHRGSVVSSLLNALNAEMAKKNWDPADLARKSGVPKTTLHNILHNETVRPQPKTLNKLAAALGIEPAVLAAHAGYPVDNVTDPDARSVRLARAIEVRPWLTQRQDLLLALSEEEFHELMDEAEYRRQRRKDRQGRNSRGSNGEARKRGANGS